MYKPPASRFATILGGANTAINAFRTARNIYNTAKPYFTKSKPKSINPPAQYEVGLSPKCSTNRRSKPRLRGKAKLQAKRRSKLKRNFSNRVQRIVNDNMQPAQTYLTDDHFRSTSTPNTAVWSMVQTNPEMTKLANLYSAFSITTGMSIAMKSINWECVIKNQNNLPARVRLYWCLARDNIEAKTSAGTAQPITTIISDGFTKSGATQTDPRVSLYQNSYFCQYFKIIKDCSVYLPPGMSHQIQRTYKIRKNYEFDKDSSTAFTVKKGAVALIMCQTGDYTNDNTTKTQLGFGLSALDVFNTSRYHFNKVLNSAAPVVILAATTRATVTNDSSYNVESGAGISPSVPV